MKMYVKSILRYLGFYALGFIFFGFAVEPVGIILKAVMPFAFPNYNPIYEKEQYIESYANIELITAIITIIIATVIAVAFDNLRYEAVIKRTDGFYTIKEEFPSYFSEFWLADILSATIVPLTFIIFSAFTLPEKLAEWTDILVYSTRAFTNQCGLILGGVLLLITSVISRLPAAIVALRRYRGMWLADIGN